MLRLITPLVALMFAVGAVAPSTVWAQTPKERRRNNPPSPQRRKSPWTSTLRLRMR
jgi:hypothetical protein